MGSGILFLVFCLLHFGVHVHVCCLAVIARENENVRGGARGREEGRGTRIDVYDGGRERQRDSRDRERARERRGSGREVQHRAHDVRVRI